MLKAIETSYKGYLFRSRLEARWAVFFDTLGFEWEYEPEGFELPDGQRYVPDFRMPTLMHSGAAWVEVKPVLADETWPSVKKAINFAVAAKAVLILAVGMPDRTSRILIPAVDERDRSIPWCELPEYADAYEAARTTRFWR